MNNLKETPVYKEHLKLGAKMIEFAGYSMPVKYSSIIDEHLAVRKNVGLFDVSHMGEVFVSGKESTEFLQSLVPQNISRLQEGKAVYSQLTNESSGIIDDLIIYKLKSKDEAPSFLLIINASRIEEDLRWIEKNKNSYQVIVDNQSENYSLFAIQGPLAFNVLEDIGISLDEHPKRFEIKQLQINSSPVFISRTGYTGEDGFEILVNNTNAVNVWIEILLKGHKYDMKPVGIGARDTLRLEASLLLYGQDIDEETTPVEAGLSWSIDKNKENDYLGKELIFKQIKNEDIQKYIIGFKMKGKAIPRCGYEIYKNNEKIGYVTSGGVGPYIGANIGLGYVTNKELTKLGTNIEIKVREKFFNAEIVKRPFYSKK